MSKTMIKDIQVILLIVKDVPSSDNFYGNILGLKKIFQDRDRIIYKIGSGRLMIHPAHGEFKETDHKLGWGVALYLEVDNVDEAIKQLEGAAMVHSKPEDKSWGERVAGITDPDGYHIYLSQALPHTWKKRT
jgi:uncharacterized glyoxalase superfamily protein PhnB